MSGIDALRQSLQADIDRFDRESRKHKRLHRRCQTAVIALTAITTMVAGAGLLLPSATWAKAIQFAVLCLTAATAAVTSWAGMHRARELWQHEREVYYALIDIQRGIEFVAANRELKAADLEDFFHKIDAVLGSSSQKWALIQQKKEA